MNCRESIARRATRNFIRIGPTVPPPARARREGDAWKIQDAGYMLIAGNLAERLP